MLLSKKGMPQVNGRLQNSQEQAIIDDLIEETAVAGVRADRLSILNFYVAFKSQPFLLLTAPAQTGKVALVHSLAHLLTSEPTAQYHTMVGHARWATHSQNVSQFVEAQARFNTSKLLMLIEEAVRPENHDRLYIACLTNVSPAELHTIFSIPGWQMWPNMEPIPYPPNLRLIGTMDTDHFRWWSPSLLSNTIVVPWFAQKTQLTDLSPQQSVTHEASLFLQACVRTDQAAYTRLRHNLYGQRQPFEPLVRVMDILCEEGVDLPQTVMNQAIIFLANAWTADGCGLFAPTSQLNLNIALDLALAQVVLPWLGVNGRVEPTRRRLNQLLAGRFEQAATFLQKL
jgi:hypothetical protein